ncbi:MAG: peptidylprolyl isomerase [Ferruginibacter sp.]|nr:peptidylprolyl isomerase [Ferruginibacter sp.]
MKFVRIILSIVFALCICNVSIAQVKKPVVKKKVVVVKKPVVAKPAVAVKIPGTRIKLTTDSGVIVLRLYDKTPLHRDNFIKLVNDKYFDSLLFHRVIGGFMIQGGDPQSKTAPAGTMLGGGDIGYTIPAEFDTNYFHKKGALAAARTENPAKASSGCQFYIVQGTKYDDNSLSAMEMQMGRKFSPKKRKVYKTVGGTPFLDMNYTVFGETESGFDVIDKIAKMQGDGYNRPFTDIRMKMEILK